MKKIYTSTFHRANNYGAVLQAYALQKCLLSNGYNTEIIDYDNKSISKSNNVFIFIKEKPLLSFLLSLKNVLMFYYIIRRNYYFNQSRKKLITTDYIGDNYKLIKPDNSDIFIVGSDQIWNPTITNGLDNVYTLNLNNVKNKISYAASCGKVETIKNVENDLAICLKSFAFLSVREYSLKDYLEKLMDNKIEVVLDPTLLITKEEWLIYSSKKELMKEKYIFSYEVSNGNDLYYYTVNELAKRTGLRIVYFKKNDLKNIYKCKKKSCYVYGPKEWLNLLINAEYVVTTSFHGTALSTIFNKKAFVVLSTSPDRITTLLNSLKLENIIVKTKDDFERAYKHEIDWEKSNRLLEIQRNKSKKWLFDSIEGCEYEQR